MNTNAPQTSIELIDKYGEKVTNMLQQLADNIGVSIDKFWPLFIKQQVIEGYLSVSIWTVVTLSSLICLYVNRESLKEGEEFNIRFCLVILSGIFLLATIP